MRKIASALSVLSLLAVVLTAGCSRPQDPKAYVPGNALVVGVFNPALFTGSAAALAGEPRGDFQPLAVLLEQKDFPRDQPIYFFLDTDLPNRHAFVVHFPQGNAGEFFDVLVGDAKAKELPYREIEILGSRTLDWTGDLTRYRATQVNDHNLLFTYNMNDDRIGVIMARRGENRLLKALLEEIAEKKQDDLLLFCRSERSLDMDIEITAAGDIVCTYALNDPEQLEKLRAKARQAALEAAANRDNAGLAPAAVVELEEIVTNEVLFSERMARMIGAQPYPLSGLLAAARGRAEAIFPEPEEEKEAEITALSGDPAQP